MTKSINSADCVVIGGGLLGLLTARKLAQEGMAVTLLERGALCRESSWAGGGILSPLVPWQYADAVSQLVEWRRRGLSASAAGLSCWTPGVYSAKSRHWPPPLVRPCCCLMWRKFAIHGFVRRWLRR
jgi:glycine/D-amino acid oxidase-like deaminating enzyme